VILKWIFISHSLSKSKLNSSDFVEDDGQNGVVDEMMNDGSTKGKIYDYNYNRSTEIDKQNENKE